MINVFRSEPIDFGTMVTKEVIKEHTDYYELIDCRTFDVVNVEWKGQAISLFVDDEGMMVSGNLGRMVEGYPQPLFGTIVVAGGVDNYGRTLSVPEEISILDMSDFIGEVQYVVK